MKKRELQSVIYSYLLSEGIPVEKVADGDSYYLVYDYEHTDDVKRVIRAIQSMKKGEE